MDCRRPAVAALKKQKSIDEHFGFSEALKMGGKGTITTIHVTGVFTRSGSRRVDTDDYDRSERIAAASWMKNNQPADLSQCKQYTCSDPYKRYKVSFPKTICFLSQASQPAQKRLTASAFLHPIKNFPLLRGCQTYLTQISLHSMSSHRYHMTRLRALEG